MNIPHSTDAEQAVLGAILVEPECLDDLIQIITTPKAFYEPRHQKIYGVILDLYAQKKGIDPILISDRCEDTLSYITELMDAGIVSNVKFHAEIVDDYYRKRRLIDACGKIIQSAQNGQPADETLADAERSIFSIAKDSMQSNSVSYAELAPRLYENYEQIKAQGGRLQGIPTGYIDMDIKLSGLHGGRLYVIGADTGHGKSSLALNLADNVGLLADHHVYYFSMEMLPEELAQRSWFGRAQVDIQKALEGGLDEYDESKAGEYLSKFSDTNVHIDSTPNLSIEQLSAKLRKACAKYPIKLAVVDYIHLMKVKSSDRNDLEIAYITKGLKALAMELRIPVIAVSQFSYSHAKREDPRPRRSDLKGSSAISQDADTILLIYHKKGDAGRAEIIIDKQRGGPTGSVFLTWRPEYTRFENLAMEGF